MRFVMPALFIRLPARMKKGTASSGKLSMPLTMRWITTNGGRPPLSRMNSSEAPAMAMATGMPPAIRERNRILSMGSAVVHRRFGTFEHGVAALEVGAHHERRAHGH